MSLSKPRIVVVGAGMAGISAAVHLVDNGLDNVVVLEAADRIGGRIHTVPFGDETYPIELGANWIHGASLENPTFELADKLAVLYPFRFNNRNSCRFMRENGSEIDRDTVKECVHAFQRMDEKLRAVLPLEMKKQSANPISMKTLLDKLLDEEIATFVKRFPNNDDKIDDINRVSNAMKIHLAFHEGDELHKVSFESDDVGICGGDVHVPHGYIQLLEYLQNRLPKDCIRLQSEVANITLLDDTNIEISLKNGKKYFADHVIVTCSIGYLKKHHNGMFSPPLPVSKVNVINSLGFGRVDKIFLEFDRPVTSPTYQSIGFAWDHTNIGSDKREWFRMLFGFDQVFTRDNTVLGWVVGDAAEYMESLSDTEIGQTCVELLRKFLRDESIPSPKQVLVSRWCSNPYVYGCYSYTTPSGNPGERVVLAEPVLSSSGEPVILFAGEATVEEESGCTHGARTSGIREAQRLINLKPNDKLHSMM